MLQLSENLVCLGFAEQDGVIAVETFSAKVSPAGALQVARGSSGRGGLLLSPLEVAQVWPHQELVHPAAPVQLRHVLQSKESALKLLGGARRASARRGACKPLGPALQCLPSTSRREPRDSRAPGAHLQGSRARIPRLALEWRTFKDPPSSEFDSFGCKRIPKPSGYTWEDAGAERHCARPVTQKSREPLSCAPRGRDWHGGAAVLQGTVRSRDPRQGSAQTHAAPQPHSPRRPHSAPPPCAGLPGAAPPAGRPAHCRMLPSPEGST